jgi:hypothetical protein
MTQVKALVDAYDAFIRGCKTDGTWNAIKASCVMAGWDELNGALTPLVGTAPTRFNFVAGDYNRKTGLVGNGSNKRLSSNRNNNTDPQNSKHMAVWASELSTATFSVYINSSTGSITGRSHIVTGPAGGTVILKVNGSSSTPAELNASTGLLGVSRSNALEHVARVGGVNTTQANTSALLSTDEAIGIFARSTGTTPPSFGSPRLAFYSIGESLDLALLDARVTTLINAIAAAIP